MLKASRNRVFGLVCVGYCLVLPLAECRADEVAEIDQLFWSRGYEHVLRLEREHWLPRLLAAIEADTPPLIRAFCVMALGYFGPHAPDDAIRKLFNDPDYGPVAVVAAGFTGDIGFEDQLVSMLRRSQWPREAAGSLGALHATNAVPYIAAQMKQDPDGVQAYLGALSWMAAPEARSYIEEYMAANGESAVALRALHRIDIANGPDSTAQLLDELEVGDEEATWALKALRARDRATAAPEVRRWLDARLVQLRERIGRPVRFDEDEVAFEAALALYSLGGELHPEEERILSAEGLLDREGIKRM